MLSYVYGHDELVADFVAALIPACHGRGLPKPCTAFGVIDESGRLIAGVAYHNYDPDAGVIEMSGAALPGSRWLTRETLRRMYTYPFLQCGCQMVVMRVQADDEPLLRQLAAFNYAFVRVPRMFGRDKDGIVCLLTDEAWIANKVCQRYKHHLDPLAMDEAA